MSLNFFVDKFGGNYVGAVAENGKLVEFRLETADKTVTIGSIFKGRVENVLCGMNAAFVDVGLDKNGYLSADDISLERSELAEIQNKPSVSDLKIGDEIMVQAVKDPAGTKGVRLSANVSFAGRYVVYLPTIDFVGVSRKITDAETRERLLELGRTLCPKQTGVIMRTAASGADKSDIKKEIDEFKKRYAQIVKQFKKQEAPSCLYEEGNLAIRLIRDVYSSKVDKFVVGDQDTYDTVVEYAKKFKTDLRSKITLYTEKTDMFARYGLSTDVETLINKNVALKSGGYLVIDETEALTVIDVNTGKFTGRDDLEETVYETNIEASEEIARQLRLRNISGIVIIDYIDMHDEEHRRGVLEALTTHLADDREKCNVVGMSSLGLVELTRKKKRRKSASNLLQRCPYCQGTGFVQSNDYVVMRIRAGLLDLFANGYDSAIIDLNVDVAEYIFAKRRLKGDVEKIWSGKRIYLIPHRTYHKHFFLIKGDNGQVLDVPEQARLLF